METERHWRFTFLRSTVSVAALLLLMTIGHVADAPPASACTCGAIGDDDTAKDFAEADAVFVGEVLDYSDRRSDGTFSDRVLWLFRVEQVYKGSVHERQGVLSSMSSLCGLSVPTTGRVLVFARRPPERFPWVDRGDLSASGCAGSRAIESLPVSELLGEPVPPRPGVGGSLTLDEPRGHAWTIVVTALTVAGVFLLATGASRKWRTARRQQADGSVGH